MVVTRFSSTSTVGDNSHEIKYWKITMHPLFAYPLGRDQFWPVAVLGPYEGETINTLLPSIPNQLIARATVVEIPKSWHVVQLVGLALAFFFCWSLWHSSVFSRLQSSARFAPAVRDRRLALILIAGLTIEFILLILMWPALHGAQSSGWGLEGWLLLAAFAVFCTTLVEGINRALAEAPKCVLAGDSTEPQPREHESQPRFNVGKGIGASTVGAMQATATRHVQSLYGRCKATAAAAREATLVRRRMLRAKLNTFVARWKSWMGVGLFVVVVLVLLWGVGKGEPDAETSALVRFCTTLRTVQLSSGLSFIMPTFFFLTVWLWWAESVSTGYALLDDRRPRLPKNMKNSRVKFFRQEAFPDLCALITPGPFRFLHYVVVLAGLALAGRFLMGNRHPIMT